MGCDIHCYVEYRDKAPSQDDKWQSFGGRINPGRHYTIFAKLVGVRNYHEVEPLSEPRGLPSGLGWNAGGDYCLFISDTDSNSEGNCSRANAEKWVAAGHSKYVTEHRVTNPDWHSHSWCNADELASVLVGLTQGYEQEYHALVACLRSFEQQGYYSRLVFWFDN